MVCRENLQRLVHRVMKHPACQGMERAMAMTATRFPVRIATESDTSRTDLLSQKDVTSERAALLPLQVADAQDAIRLAVREPEVFPDTAPTCGQGGEHGE